MRCLCCNKELDTKDVHNWHTSCINSFFEDTIIPSIDILESEDSLSNTIKAFLTNKATVTGVQKKLSLHLSKSEHHLKVVGSPLNYILKMNTPEIPEIVESEHLVMLMANECSIKTPPHALIKTNDGYAYITKRMDRVNDKKIHMEDFCQLSNKPTEYKYTGSYEQCMKIINKYSDVPNLDKVEFFYRLIFCFITGNSDMHLKNFSLIEDKEICLSKAYDLLPVNILINDYDEVALTLNGKKRNLTRNDFLDFALRFEIEKKRAIKIISDITSKENRLHTLISESFLSNKLKDKFHLLLDERIKRLIK